MVNRDLIKIFHQIADLLEIKGEDAFRINSYRKAARTLEDLTQDISEIAAANGLADLPGIGKSTREKIEQFLKTGRIDRHQELLGEVPAGLPELLNVRGLGPKKVQLIWKQLGVASLDDLRAAIESGKLAELKGMGAKSVELVRQGIEFQQRGTGRTPMGLAWPLAMELADAMGADGRVKRVEVAGSLRRGAEMVGDIDIVCESGDGAAVIEVFTALRPVVRVLGKGPTKGSVVVQRRDGGEMEAQLRVIPVESFGAALQYFTGSKEHNVRLRELAGKKGWKLNEWGLFEGDKQIAGADEEGIYRKLGLLFIPPELREDRGEIDSAGKLPKLIERTDIRGDFHMHTTASDGTVSAAEMARAAADLGYEYIAISDHSRSSAIANGLSVDRMWRQIEQIRKLNEKLDTISVLAACECDILADGSMDYPDAILAACDLVIASVHSRKGNERDHNTRRIIAAMENPFVTIIGHATGRLLNKREAMDLDMEAIVAAAARTGTALELNASWQRLDLNDRHVRMAREAGVMITIDTDAHATAQLRQMEFGIRVARRGWLSAYNVLNTRPLTLVKKWIANKRRRADKDKPSAASIG